MEFVDRPMSQDPHDQLLLQIRGAVAEYERSLIAERMRRGRLQKYQAGELLPWTHPPYGFRCCRPHAFQFAAGNDVKPRATIRQQLQNSQRRVCLHRIANQMVPSPQCLIKKLKPLNDLIGRIDIKRRPVALGQRLQ